MIPNLTKQANFLLAGFTYLRSTLTGNPANNAMPLALGVELTNNCNLKCPECSAGSGLMDRQRGFMDISLYHRLLDEMRSCLLNVNLYFQGEPMLHPDICSFISSSHGVNSVISTNGHFLSEELSYGIIRSGLKKLIVSLDGADQETYSVYRRDGDVEKVIRGINEVSKVRKKLGSSMKIEIQVLVNKFNEHQLPDLKKLAFSVNAKLKLKSMQVLKLSNAGKWMPSDRKFRRYESDGEGYRIRSVLPDRCARMWFNPVVTWDAKVIPCCFDKNADHIMGDLNRNSFRDIWEGPSYRIFRQNVLNNRQIIDICSNCSSGLKGVMT